LPVLDSSIHERYGWLARLAETFGQPDSNPQRAAVLADAQRTLTIMVVGFGALGVVGLIGLGLLITAIVLISLGKLTLRTRAPVGPSHVYIEAFAIYLGGFILVSIALQLIGDTPLIVHVAAQGLFVVIAAIWPMLRGVAWTAQQQDWGVHTGRGVLLEAVCGIGGYVASLPLVALGLMITLLLSRLAHVSVSHPIASEDGMAPWQLFFIASVFAPLTEELLFRGALLSHLRGVWGVVMAAVISGTIFASVHPQGWAAIPALASIGASFALIRQWRGSLVPSITAHALNNGVLVALIVLLSR
jgi:membrane protease YdiL (CAAX protease family)